ncbi:alanyl-tRNA editing protein [Nostoc sp. 3335mG]|nr:alanyl-tRNA editing protein [Nostoc sp. 3335mG]
MTFKRYLGDTSLIGVVEIAELIAGDRPVVRVKETWFHPQGGGQKGDRGTLGPVEVLDVRYAPDGTIDHVVSTIEGLGVGKTYPFTVDPEWRRLHSNLHSAGHVLSGVCEDMFPGTQACAGHHWPGECRVDFSGRGLGRIILNADELEDAVNLDIKIGTPIAIVGDPYVNRACGVGNYRPIACGGTHVPSAAELGSFKIRSVKKKGELVRVGYELTA